MIRYLSLLIVFAALAAGLGSAADFLTGQGARLVIGQTTFTQQDAGASDTLLGGVGGVAYANDTLFMADTNRLNFTPINHRVLLFTNISKTFPPPNAVIPPFSGRCPVCVGKANLVLGQADFKGQDYKIAQNGVRLPAAVASDGKVLAVADTANNRVLIWNSIPTTNGQNADVVVGQPNFTAVQPVVVDNKSLRAPQGVWIQGTRLFVADTQNSRVLIWNTVPKSNNQPADLVLGQADFNSSPPVDLTRASLDAQNNTLLNPVSVTSDGTRLYVTDLGHNRVLIWNSIPTRNQQPADVVIGQKDFQSATPNDATNLCDSNGTDKDGNKTYPARCGKTLDFPRFALSDGKRLFVADGGNDRVLIFNSIPTQNSPKADVVLGQPDEFQSVVTSITDLFHPLLRQSAADITPTPTSLASDGTNLYVTDPSNRRVLVFTPGENLLPINAVRNAASREIFAFGGIGVAGDINADDQITVTIDVKSYVYKILKDDTIDKILVALAKVINAGNGDPLVIAQAQPSLSLVKLQARTGGVGGNDIAISVTASTNAKIIVQASGATLSGGQDATTIAPGTIVSLFGTNLSDFTTSANMNAETYPRELGGVQVYVDGIPAPLAFVSPTQINAQIPFDVADANSVSVYARITRRDGSLSLTTALGVPITQSNPGLFAREGEDPRPAAAYHYSSHATGTISVDGTVQAGDIGTVTIDDRSYTYTVQRNDTLEVVRDAFIALINSNPEERVVAYPAGLFTRIRLQAKVAGPEGDGIGLAASVPSTASLLLTPTNATMCCANIAGQPVTANNPAVPGETIVVVRHRLGRPTGRCSEGRCPDRRQVSRPGAE